ncbi:MAG: type II secretion system F family protein [Acidobacteria bacterium]|nr:MAG: type II secretion system F family protein [Acidobacteriota bacterium]
MSAELAVSLLALTLSVALLSGMLASSVLQHYAPARRRLRQIAAPTTVAGWARPIALTEEPNALAERICRLMPRTEKRMGEMRARLVAAGYRSQAAPVVYAAAQIVAAIGTGVLVLVVSGTMAYALFALVCGFGLPSAWLTIHVRKRTRMIRNGLPDVVDLLIVCLESGCSLHKAILKSGEELALAYKPIGDELALVATEIRAGKPRADAFMNFAHRTGIDDVRSLMAMLVQTDRFGTSLAQALRLHADLLRTRRRQHAEERAAKANVKLLIPLVLCLFPAFYILTLGPSMLHFARLFMDAVSGIQ